MLDSGAASSSGSGLALLLAVLSTAGILAIVLGVRAARNRIKARRVPEWVGRFRDIFNQQDLFKQSVMPAHFVFLRDDMLQVRLTYYRNGVLVFWAHSGLCVSIADTPEHSPPKTISDLNRSHWMLVADSVAQTWENGPWNPAVEQALVAVECAIVEVLNRRRLDAEERRTTKKDSLQTRHEAWTVPDDGSHPLSR